MKYLLIAKTRTYRKCGNQTVFPAAGDFKLSKKRKISTPDSMLFVRLPPSGIHMLHIDLKYFNRNKKISL